MAAWTAAELRNAVLTRLGRKNRNQAAESEDAQVVDDLWPSLHATLERRHLAPFAVDAIPKWAKHIIKEILAAKAAPDFGFSGNRLREKIALGQVELLELQTQCSGQKRATTRFESF